MWQRRGRRGTEAMVAGGGLSCDMCKVAESVLGGAQMTE